jgi:hypothetical protein
LEKFLIGILIAGEDANGILLLDLSMLLLSGVELTVAESQLPWYISGSELCL